MNIEAVIENFILEELMYGKDQTKLDPDQSLVKSGILDSLALLRLINFIEERFGVKIEDGEVMPENFDSINVIKALIESKSA